MAISYRVTGRAMTLDEATSRACGHLSDIDGESPDGSTADRTRREIRADAQALANTLRRTIEVYATHPSSQDWIVDAIEPEVAS